MDITLIICAYNEEKEIAATLDAANKAAHGRFKEIIVVDNASTDHTAEIARDHGARVIREDHKGLTYARLAGLVAASSEYVAYIDADSHLSKNWFDKAEKIFKKHPEIVSLSGPRRSFGIAKWKSLVVDSMWFLAPPVYWISGFMILGANFIAKKNALEEIGGFDTSIRFYGEDTDIARRLSKVGKVMFRMPFFVYSSGRRFEKEGLFKPNVTYAMNYLWPAIFGKPYTNTYQDIRNV